MLQTLRIPEVPSPTPQPPPAPHLEPPLVYVPPTWEYRHVRNTVGQELDEQELNALGADGWELVGITTGADGVHFYFKRPLP